jgi:hypothetical protein
VENLVNFFFGIAVFQINRDSPVREFELNWESSTLGLELVIRVEIDQYIRFFDVQVKQLLVVHFLKGVADLAEDDEGGRLVVWFREVRQIVEGAVLAELEHKVLLILTIKVIVHLMNTV